MKKDDVVVSGAASMAWEPPAGVFERWQPELDRVVPRTRAYEWLLLHWVPGDPWQPVHRWFIYRMVPREKTPKMILRDLMGPNPRWYGHYDRTVRRFVRERQFSVDQIQWKLFRQYGRWAKPYWVVQGDNGGHRRRYDFVEKQCIFYATGEKDVEPPVPGELCYAEPDARLIQKFGEMDKVRLYKATVGAAYDYAERHPDAFDEDEQRTIRQLREQIMGWLGERVENALDTVAPVSLQRFYNDFDGASRMAKDQSINFEQKLEQQKRSFIDTGV